MVTCRWPTAGTAQPMAQWDLQALQLGVCALGQSKGRGPCAALLLCSVSVPECLLATSYR